VIPRSSKSCISQPYLLFVSMPSRLCPRPLCLPTSLDLPLSSRFPGPRPLSPSLPLTLSPQFLLPSESILPTLPSRLLSNLLYLCVLPPSLILAVLLVFSINELCRPGKEFTCLPAMVCSAGASHGIRLCETHLYPYSRICAHTRHGPHPLACEVHVSVSPVSVLFLDIFAAL